MNAATWKERTIGELVDFHDYKRVPLSGTIREQRKGAYPYYGASGIIDYIDDYIFDGRYLLIAEDGENLRSRNTPLAFFASGKFWVNNHAHIITAKAGEADDYFIKAWFDGADIGGYITGAAQPKLSQENLKRITLTIPHIDTQRKIASILSAYDDLIENNIRRIKILEDMAQAIYREWFVEFCAPGIELRKATPEEQKLTGKDVFPKGWEIRRLGEFVSVDKGISYKGSGLTPDGKPMVNLKNILPGGGFRRDATKPYSGEHKTRHIVHTGDIVLANTDLTQAGNVVGSPALVPKLKESKIIFSHHLYAIRFLKNLQLGHLFTYYLLLSIQFKGFAKGMASGTTVLGMPKEGVLSFTFSYPHFEIMNRFDEEARSINNSIENLHQRNEVLEQTRDLLLPKLISGEIDVEDLSINSHGVWG
jgi:type I restriction enzyme S subunit